MSRIRTTRFPPVFYSLRCAAALQPLAGARTIEDLPALGDVLALVAAIALAAVLAPAATARAQPADPAVYVVGGAEAWAEASRAGFEFHPVIPDDRFILSGARDGAWTTLKTCASPIEPCEAEARVTENELVVFGCPDGCDRIHEFRLFAGRALAPGWRIADVEMTGPWAWSARPRGDDPAFAVRVESRGGRTASAVLRSIRLLGPPGADWREAFAGDAP